MPKALSTRGPQPDLRPRERVLHYLTAEFDRPELKAGCRLPTVRKLAAQLDVSVPTVHSVFQQLAKQGRIRTAVGNGTFLVSPKDSSSDTLKIALNVPAPEEGLGHLWSHQIALAITLAASRSKRRIHLAPLRSDLEGEDEELRQLINERSHVDGLILFPVADDVEVRQAYELVGKPVVDVNPPSDTATANYVTTDYFGRARQLAGAWKGTGRKRIAFLGHRLEEVVSEHLICSGLVTGLGSHLGTTISFRVIETESIDEEDAFQAMRRVATNRSTTPDAIYCAGDHMALGVLRACREAGLRVPEDVSVVGGTGLELSESACPQLTRLKQPFDQLGKELVSLLCGRIEQKNISLPGKIVPTVFMGGGTTRPEENEILGIGESR